MSKQKETPQNYTEEMVAAIREAAPLNLEKAKAVGDKIGRSYRSVISKAKSEGIEYVAAVAPARKPKSITKAEMVTTITANVGFDCEGLEKAPRAVLARFVEFTTPEPETETETEGE